MNVRNDETIVAEGKAMGLTPGQIAQAKAEGVTSALGLRRIEKNTRGLPTPPSGEAGGKKVSKWVESNLGQVEKFFKDNPSGQIKLPLEDHFIKKISPKRFAIIEVGWDQNALTRNKLGSWSKTGKETRTILSKHATIKDALEWARDNELSKKQPTPPSGAAGVATDIIAKLESLKQKQTGASFRAVTTECQSRMAPLRLVMPLQSPLKRATVWTKLCANSTRRSIGKGPKV